jgi:DNA-binding PadR family transcriptional regulator
LAKAGFLKSQGNDGYTFTDKGRTTLQEVNHAFYTRLGEIASLFTEDLTQLESLLMKVVEACLKAQEPESKWGISTTHRGHPGQTHAPLAKIDQRLDDLNAFRDDVHLAAWQPYEVSGRDWETFTFIWRGDAQTAEELVEKLPFRNHSAEAYHEAFGNLASRGWLEKTADGYQVTDKGRALREQVEEATDCHFFAPWACLSGDEKVQLHTLLTQLRNSLQEMAENNEDVG